MRSFLAVPVFAAALSTALQLPHIPSAQDALNTAEALLQAHRPAAAADTVLSPASDFTLASIPGDEHVTITSAHYPQHRIRIKSTEGWCDPTVRSYSGYLDVGYGKDLFFYFFESRDKPSEDPVVMWINGGPGCSSSLGLFMELGPCSVKDDPKSANDTKFNPHAWNSNANIFFVDEPINVGFSKAQHGQTVSTTEQAAGDIQAFVAMFFDAFKEFEGREFHMAGESYGGRYLPVFASAVVDGNKALRASGRTPINLKSVMIGNGATDQETLIESYYPYTCTIQGGLNETVQTIGACAEMAVAVPKCHKFFRAGCVETNDQTTCNMAVAFCEAVLGDTFLSAGVNPYDVSKPCTLQELADSLCYPETDKIKTYLDLPDVRGVLGVNDKAPWAACDNGVGMAFAIAQDSWHGQTIYYVRGLLERGIRVLNYAGTFDFICNHMGNEVWTHRMEWTGQAGFVEAKWQDWEVDGKVAGSFKTYGKLSLLKILYAGHMVPFDKPKEALQMLNSWIKAGL